MGIAETILSLVCKPVLIYTVFLTALICFDLTQGNIYSAGKNFLFLIAGAAMLMLLCLGGFETAAWILLGIIPFFFTALIALLLITQIVRTEAIYNDGTKKVITGSKLRSFFGIPDKSSGSINNGQMEDPNQAFNGADKIFAPTAEDMECAAENKPAELPTPPPIPSAERIVKQVFGASSGEQPVMCSTCNSCDTCS